MQDIYICHVNDLSFTLQEQQINATNLVKNTDGSYHILQNNQSFIVQSIQKNANKSYTITVNGNAYLVQIKDSLDTLIQIMGISASTTKVVNDIKAPMPGLLLDILVSVGQQVTENQPVLILEAMKMENTLLSPKTGVVKEILLQKGNAVEKGQVLVTFE
jgi:biotin carboxyl carrier protein